MVSHIVPGYLLHKVCYSIVSLGKTCKSVRAVEHTPPQTITEPSIPSNGIVECENLGCYPKIPKLGATFQLKTSLSKKL
jgi:hypothetical protein